MEGEQVHVYRPGEKCVLADRQVLLPPVGEPSLVAVSHEADPRKATVAQSWHEISECPFVDDDT